MFRHRPPPAAVAGGSADDVEAQFYDALQRADLEALMAVWADDDEVVCVHPGGTRVVGAAAIRASFESIFAGGTVPVHPEQVHRVQWMGGALHHLLERVAVPGPGKREQTAWVMATNVYMKTAQGWRLVAHHASPAALDPPPTLGDPPSTLH